MPSGTIPQGLVNSDEATFKDFYSDTYEYYAK
jgi:fatty acid amide hydrolase